MQYDFALTPLGGQIINVKGRFFKYRTGTGPIRVKLTDGGVIDLMPGQGVSNRNFESIEIVDRSGAINAGTILAGDFDFRDERISGTVDVVDGGKSRTLSGRTYMCAISAGNSAGQFAFNELWNPPGSNKNVIVEQWSLSSGAASIIYAGWHNVRLTTGPSGSISKKAGGALSSALSGSVYRVAAGGIASVLTASNVSANQTIVVMPKEPIVIPPGFSFYCENETASSSLQTWVEFFEEDVLA
jgi:hypothetical protein